MQVRATAEFDDWLGELSYEEKKQVLRSAEYLRQFGLALGEPHTSAIKGAKGLRELRVLQGRSPLRIFYVFDKSRDAWLLIGGSKANDKKFYERMINKALSISRSYGI